MSANYLMLIPIKPDFVPSVQGKARLEELLPHIAPDAESSTLHTSEDIEFIGPGGNFEAVSCPTCNSDLFRNDWWHETMDEAYRTMFRNLTVVVPCCGATISLNDLHYKWPAGFARFKIELRNPNIPDIDIRQVRLIENYIGCSIRKIWQRI